jgi:hypothetical protein
MAAAKGLANAPKDMLIGPQTPQAPIWISAAWAGILGQGTLSIVALPLGPAKVATRIDGLVAKSMLRHRPVLVARVVPCN